MTEAGQTESKARKPVGPRRKTREAAKSAFAFVVNFLGLSFSFQRVNVVGDDDFP